MKLVVGLGNPNKEHKYNRHNVGFILLDKFVSDRELEFKTFSKANSLVTQEGSMYLCKPQSFMNNSGDSVSKMSKFYKINPKDIYVIHDDLDLDFGIIKKQFGRGAAGHHGIEDIIEKLDTQEFWRIRVGIGNPKDIDSASYVLKDFTQKEKDTLRGIDLNEYILVEEVSR